MKAVIYNTKGEKESETSLPEEIFGVKVNSDLIYQVVRSEMANKRQNSAHSKERGEVRGGGKKPWRQKGTGRARHGSSRSPIWIGGGVTFGPRNERNYKKKINKKVKRKALFMVLSGKYEKDMIFLVSDIDIKEPKTKSMRQFLDSLSFKGSVLVLLPEINREVILSSRNIEGVSVMQAKDINPLDLLSYKNLVIPKKSLDVIKDTFAKQI